MITQKIAQTKISPPSAVPPSAEQDDLPFAPKKPVYWTLVLSPFVVCLTTLAIWRLHEVVSAHEPGVYVRPSLGLYVLTILFMTWRGGMRTGFLTLILSELTALYFLLPPVGWGVQHPSDWVSLGNTFLIGSAIIFGIDSLQRRAALVAVLAEKREENSRLRLEMKGIQERSLTTAIAAQEQSLREMLSLLLMPELPAALPGLELKVHYTVDLGDSDPDTPFFDAFAASENIAVLLVGSAGLPSVAAAPRIAALRQMLRYTLCCWASGSELSSPSAASEIAAEMNSLMGGNLEQVLFREQVPLRLGITLYDSRSRTLTFLACGSLTALIWSAHTGVIRQAAQTDPVTTPSAEEMSKNSFFPNNSFFQGQTLTLSPDDLVVLASVRDLPLLQDVSFWENLTAKRSDTQRSDTQKEPPIHPRRLITALLKTSEVQNGPKNPCLLSAVITENNLMP